MAQVHPTTQVAPGAELGDEVTVEAFATVGPEVRVGSRARIMSHAYVTGRTDIGAECTLFPFSVVGMQTQDLKFKGGSTGVSLGDRTVIREFATIHAATQDGDQTCIGSDCLIMAYAHVAHCCRLGNQVIVANATQIAGHVVVEDQATIEGLVGIVQFTRIGRLAFIGGYSKVDKDVPPFMIADGVDLAVRGVNVVGMTRRGFSDAAQDVCKKAYKLLYRQHLTVKQALEQMEQQAWGTRPEIQHLVSFVRGSQRGIAR